MLLAVLSAGFGFGCAERDNVGILSNCDKNESRIEVAMRLFEGGKLVSSARCYIEMRHRQS